MTHKEKILEFVEFKGLSKSQFCRKCGLSISYLDSKGSITSDKLTLILKNFRNFNVNWLLFDDANMIIPEEKQRAESKNLIPLYEEVVTVGGNNEIVAESNIAYDKVNRYINVGDLFKGATSAISHYGDSMVEYQSGCLIVYKELVNKSEIVWGRNHVVETDEMRVTKKIAEIDENYIMCYSTNKETYTDGRLVHQPIKIKKKDIRRIGRVLGNVNREES